MDLQKQAYASQQILNNIITLEDSFQKQSRMLNSNALDKNKNIRDK